MSFTFYAQYVGMVPAGEPGPCSTLWVGTTPLGDVGQRLEDEARRRAEQTTTQKRMVKGVVKTMQIHRTNGPAARLKVLAELGTALQDGEPRPWMKFSPRDFFNQRIVIEDLLRSVQSPRVDLVPVRWSIHPMDAYRVGDPVKDLKPFGHYMDCWRAAVMSEDENDDDDYWFYRDRITTAQNMLTSFLLLELERAGHTVVWGPRGKLETPKAEPMVEPRPETGLQRFLRTVGADEIDMLLNPEDPR